MPIYMDRHYIEGATRHAIANAHEKDLEYESRYGVHFLTYWFDEARSTAFCLVDAPNRDAILKTHAEAHGDIPHEIIEVDPAVVEAFLGRVGDPAPASGRESAAHAAVDSAFRAIMFTDLKDSTVMNTQLGEARAMHLLHIHNALTRNALREWGGREVKHLGDGIMASFVSTHDAVQSAIAIQQAFANHNAANADAPLHLRIGLSAGEPLAEGNDLFGTAVQLAARLCAHARPDQILAATVVREQYRGDESIFADAGRITPKGFDQPMPVYAVRWRTAE